MDLKLKSNPVLTQVSENNDSPNKCSVQKLSPYAFTLSVPTVYRALFAQYKLCSNATLPGTLFDHPIQSPILSLLCFSSYNHMKHFISPTNPWRSGLVLFTALFLVLRPVNGL